MRKPKKSTNFSSYMETEQIFHIIRVKNDATTDNWIEKRILCDCPSFQKDFLCKHTVGIAVKLKLTIVSDAAKNSATPIGMLPKRGRPPLAKRLLFANLIIKFVYKTPILY